jgi:type IV pilus assembly protein PilQ
MRQTTTITPGTFAAILAVAAGGLTSVALAEPGVGTMMARAAEAKANGTGNGAIGGARVADGKSQPKDQPKVKVTEHNTVDLHVKDEDLVSVLEMLSISAQKNIIVSKNVTGKVTMNLWGVSFYEALDALLHANGFAYVEKGNFIYVYTLDELEKIEKTFKKRVAKVVTLNFLNAPDAAEFVKGMLSKEGEIKATPKVEDFQIPSNAPIGADKWALGASLVITDYEENLKAIESLLIELDTKPAQVLIESTVLQTKLTEENAFGVDFSIIGSVDFTDFATAAAGPRGVANSLINGGTGATGFTPPDNTGRAFQSTVGGTSGAGGFKAGLISNNVGVFLRMLDEVSDTTVLANPKLLTLNRQPSRVLVGRRVAYLSTTATDTSTTQTVQYLDTGVQLFVRPFVSKTGDIRMEIKPQVSTADTKEIKAAGGGTVTVPDEVTQEVVTNIMVPDGMTVVIGGLFTETTVAGRSQIPGLGDLPIIGAAFKGQTDKTTRDEIIFLVTPTIVADKTLVAQGEQAKGVEDRLRGGVKESLIPWSRERRTSEFNLRAQQKANEGDFGMALWLINQSLTLNPSNEDALRLRERILQQREVWPSNSRLQGIFGTERREEMLKINPPSPTPGYKSPLFQGNVPMKHLDHPVQQAGVYEVQPARIGGESADPLEKYMDPVAPASPATPPVDTTPGELTNGESLEPLSSSLPFDLNALFQFEPNPFVPPMSLTAPAQTAAAQPIVLPNKDATTTPAPAAVAQGKTDVKAPAATGKTDTAKAATPAPASGVGSFTNKPVEPQQATVPTKP